MFLRAVLEGFCILRYWQVWVSIFAYVILTISFLFIIYFFIVGKDEFGKRTFIGCLAHMIGGALLNAFFMSLMIAFLLPMLLGQNRTMPLYLIRDLSFPLFTLGLLAFVIVTILSIIPVVGAFISNSPSIQAFLEGLIIFRGLTDEYLGDALNSMQVQSISIYPSFWASVGFLIFAGVFTWILMMLLVAVSTKLQYTSAGEWMPIVFAPALSLLGGIIPLLMYTSYVRLSLIRLLM